MCQNHPERKRLCRHVATATPPSSKPIWLWKSSRQTDMTLEDAIMSARTIEDIEEDSGPPTIFASRINGTCEPDSPSVIVQSDLSFRKSIQGNSLNTPDFANDSVNAVVAWYSSAYVAVRSWGGWVRLFRIAESRYAI